MANSTTTIIVQLVYINQGLLMILFNSFVVTAILKYRDLRERKEYLIIAGLALADVLSGVAYLLAGSYRTYIHYFGDVTMKMSSWDCMKKPHNWFFMYGAQLAAIMLTCLSLDRFKAALHPIKYFKLQTDYAYKLLSIFYGWALVMGTAMVIGSYMEPREKIYSSLCLGWDAVGNKFFRQYYFLVRILGGSCSVILFIFVPILHHSNSKKICGTNRSIKESQNRVQKKLMKTVGISVFFTFLFYVLPNFVRINFGSDFLKSLGQFVSCIQNMNALLNVFLLMRHGEIRKGIAGVVFCKRVMPAEIQSIKKEQLRMRDRSVSLAALPKISVMPRPGNRISVISVY